MSIFDIRTDKASIAAIRFGDNDGGTGRVTNFCEDSNHMSFSIRNNALEKVGHIHYEDIDSMIEALKLIRQTWKQSNPLRASK